MSNKEKERIRYEAFQYAYNLVKDKGLEELGNRLTKRDREVYPAFANDSAIKEFEYNVKNNVFTMTVACTLGVLEGKFGFGVEDFDKFTEAMADATDSVYGGWLKWEDVIEDLRDRYGFDLNEKIRQADSTLQRTEEVLEARTSFVGEVMPYQRGRKR